MAAVTLAEVKTILGITDTSKDTQITALIPICTEQLKNYCNNRFHDAKIYCKNDTIFFTNPSTITIDSEYSFLDYKFRVGQEIEVIDSIFNDGIYTIANVTATVITINETTLEDEDESITIEVHRIKYPEQVKQILAMMINESISYQERSDMAGVSTYRLGDYSISYSNVGGMSNEVKDLIKNTIGRYASVR